MRSCSLSHMTEPLVRLRRLFFVLAVAAGTISVTPNKASAQPAACIDLVISMAEQQKMISNFRALDYHIRQHFLLEANAILSTYGDWNTIEGWGSVAGKFRTSTSDFEAQALIITKDIARSKAITDDEMRNFNGAIDGFYRLIKVGEQIAQEVSAGRVDEANRLYFDLARPDYIQVHGTLYTLMVTAERRVASVARTPCN